MMMALYSRERSRGRPREERRGDTGELQPAERAFVIAVKALITILWFLAQFASQKLINCNEKNKEGMEKSKGREKERERETEI